MPHCIIEYVQRVENEESPEQLMAAWSWQKKFYVNILGCKVGRGTGK